MPILQRMDGRDHNPLGFTIWMAGGGVKGGTVVGSTNEFGLDHGLAGTGSANQIFAVCSRNPKTR